MPEKSVKIETKDYSMAVYSNLQPQSEHLKTMNELLTQLVIIEKQIAIPKGLQSQETLKAFKEFCKQKERSGVFFEPFSEHAVVLSVFRKNAISEPTFTDFCKDFSKFLNDFASNSNDNKIPIRSFSDKSCDIKSLQNPKEC